MLGRRGPGCPRVPLALPLVPHLAFPGLGLSCSISHGPPQPRRPRSPSSPHPQACCRLVPRRPWRPIKVTASQQDSGTLARASLFLLVNPELSSHGGKRSGSVHCLDPCSGPFSTVRGGSRSPGRRAGTNQGTKWTRRDLTLAAWRHLFVTLGKPACLCLSGPCRSVEVMPTWQAGGEGHSKDNSGRHPQVAPLCPLCVDTQSMRGYMVTGEGEEQEAEPGTGWGLGGAALPPGLVGVQGGWPRAGEASLPRCLHQPRRPHFGSFSGVFSRARLWPSPGASWSSPVPDS